MKYYLAPLEGVTTYVYRNAYHKYFRKMDKYFTPFIVPHKDKKFSTKDIKALGYEEINLNFGCPSKTVVTKRRGSGFLAFPDELDKFLNEVFEQTELKISVKTRIGKEDPDEFYRILEIYNKYPIEELTIHPRIQTDYYNNTPNWDIYEVACKESKNPICYNGDIHSKEDYLSFIERFPQTEAMMLGRGIIKNPNLVSDIEDIAKLRKEDLYCFHQMILDEYIKISSGERNVLFKMKELWFYMISLFEDSEKHAKKIKKTERLKDYENIISTLFETCALRED